MTIIEVIAAQTPVFIETIVPQDPTLITTTDFRSVPQGINLTASGNGDSYLADDGLYKTITASGASSLINTYTASTAIGGHIVVYQTDSGIDIASSNSVSHASRVIGVTNSAVEVNSNVPVTLSGELVEPTWAFNSGFPVFLSINGTLTQTPPTVGFILQVGVAISPTKLLISIKLPIIL